MLTQSGAWFWPGRFIGETASTKCVKFITYSRYISHEKCLLNRRFCWDVLSMFPPLVRPFVGFDTECLTPTPMQSHFVVLLQICLGPNCVVLIPIHKIVQDQSGVFPLVLLDVLSRWVCARCIWYFGTMYMIIEYGVFDLRYRLPEHVYNAPLDVFGGPYRCLRSFLIPSCVISLEL